MRQHLSNKWRKVKVNKKVRILFVLSLGMLCLSGCGKLTSTDDTTSSSNTSKSSKNFQVTGQNDDSQYQGVVEDGKYKTSKSRGVGLSQNTDNLLNLKSFESGMLDISKTQFSPKKYIFQEGQVLSKATVLDWLGRKSKDNPTGLNPEDNGQLDADKRNPMYVQQIEEQDYMKEENGKLVLAGMTIGIGVNRKDYYQKEQYGATFTTDISKDEMIKQGKIAAQKVLERLRKMNKVGNIPIVIAMFEQAPNDSLVGGSFYAYTVSENGSTQIEDWTDTDITSCVFPVTDGKTVPNDNDATSFDGFKSKIENFFPNLAGVTAQAQYKDKKLQGLNVNITTQFYSETEITSFTQYVAQAAKTYLPSGVEVDILVKGSDGTVQSFLARSPDDSDYYTHVFSSY